MFTPCDALTEAQVQVSWRPLLHECNQSVKNRTGWWLNKSKDVCPHLGLAQLPVCTAAVVEVQQLDAAPLGVIWQHHIPHQHLVPEEALDVTKGLFYRDCCSGSSSSDFFNLAVQRIKHRFKNWELWSSTPADHFIAANLQSLIRAERTKPSTEFCRNQS